MRKQELYIFLAVVGATMTMIFFAFVFVITSFVLWLIVPSSLVYWGTTLVVLSVFVALIFLARRKRRQWLGAISIGGAVVPALILVLMLASPLIRTDRTSRRKPNQRQPLTSPSGKYVLTVPIERSRTGRGPLGFGSPYWYVTISDQNGNVLYRDSEHDFPGWFGTYWVWDEQDRVWLFGSDSGTFFYECPDRNWRKQEWAPEQKDNIGRRIVPPKSLYPPSHVRYRPSDI